MKQYNREISRMFGLGNIWCPRFWLFSQLILSWFVLWATYVFPCELSCICMFWLVLGARYFPSRRATGCDCHWEYLLNRCWQSNKVSSYIHVVFVRDHKRIGFQWSLITTKQCFPKRKLLDWFKFQMFRCNHFMSNRSSVGFTSKTHTLAYQSPLSLKPITLFTSNIASNFTMKTFKSSSAQCNGSHQILSNATNRLWEWKDLHFPGIKWQLELFWKWTIARQPKKCAILPHKSTFFSMIPNKSDSGNTFKCTYTSHDSSCFKVSRNVEFYYWKLEKSTTWKFVNYFVTNSMTISLFTQIIAIKVLWENRGSSYSSLVKGVHRSAFGARLWGCTSEEMLDIWTSDTHLDALEEQVLHHSTLSTVLRRGKKQWRQRR